MSQAFRKAFPLIRRETLQWFPGHMGKGLRQMQQKLKSVDCVIEIHDARIPFSGRNEDFRHTIRGIKPHILVMNKKDLIPPGSGAKIVERVQSSGECEHVLFTNCKDQKCEGIRRLLPLAKKLIVNSNRYNRSELSEYCIMIIGVPNVGKSSLVNILRNKHLHKRSSSPVGAVPGITRSVMNRIRISANPPIFVLDTPGILTPKVSDNETGLKLALCACLQDHLVGPLVVADYLLFRLNMEENYRYVEFMGLEKPNDNIIEVLAAGAKVIDKYQVVRTVMAERVTRPDFESSAAHFLKAFRKGEFGYVMLDKL
ncbi:mitochondrial GTPase 1 [Phlebotomus argentipes]|uniref:mitochondrial GTPase 1 n=1 Tax=Phlebotomus argentipes TaxID=94469 RepID=UPI002892F3A4|nr:mitochondrial GTPase 1 [Phlebotomus argentipes]